MCKHRGDKGGLTTNGSPCCCCCRCSVGPQLVRQDSERRGWAPKLTAAPSAPLHRLIRFYTSTFSFSELGPESTLKGSRAPASR